MNEKEEMWLDYMSAPNPPFSVFHHLGNNAQWISVVVILVLILNNNT